jgi:hypothetical protein
LANFLSAAIIDNELTDAGHKFYNDNANILTSSIGEVDLLESQYEGWYIAVAEEKDPFLQKANKPFVSEASWLKLK